MIDFIDQLSIGELVALIIITAACFIAALLYANHDRLSMKQYEDDDKL